MTYPIRPGIAAASTFPLPVVMALIALGLFGFSTAGVVYAVAFLALGAWSFSKTRRRSLTVSDQGLLAQRDAYRLTVPWSGITGTDSGTFLFVVPVEDLVVTGGAAEAIDWKGRKTKVTARLEGNRALTRIQVSLFDKNWRDGEIGQKLRALGKL